MWLISGTRAITVTSPIIITMTILLLLAFGLGGPFLSVRVQAARQLTSPCFHLLGIKQLTQSSRMMCLHATAHQLRYNIRCIVSTICERPSRTTPYSKTILALGLSKAVICFLWVECEQTSENLTVVRGTQQVPTSVNHC